MSHGLRDENLSTARAQQLIDESSERLCFIPAKGADGRNHSFSTLVLDGTLRNFVVCNQCSRAIPWEVHRDTEALIHQCGFRDTAVSAVVGGDFPVKASPKSYPEIEAMDQVVEGAPAATRLTARDINYLLKNSSERVRILPKKGKSFVWKLFSLVEVDGIQQDFVCCNQCSRLCRWKPTDGTNNLRVHVCRKHSVPPEISFTELLAEPDVQPREMVDQGDLDQSGASETIVTKRDLQGLIDSCNPRVTLIPGRGKSQVWSRFYKVKLDGELTNYTMCRDCRVVVIWKSKDGTTGLRKHACKRQRIAKKAQLPEFTSESNAMVPGYPRIEYENTDGPCLSKDQVQRLVDESSDRIRLVPGRGKSDVWMTFSIVEVDGRKMELAVCSLCNSLVTWKSKDGTNGLRKHSCKQIRITCQPENSPHCSSKTPSVVPHTEFEERMAVMCGMDLVPPDLIASPGFTNFIEYVYNLGAKNGSKIDVKDLLPSEKSVSRRVDEIAVMEKETIISELQSCSSVGLGIDVWFHNLTSKDFLTISMHYMLETEDSLIVKNRVAYTCEAESKTEEFLREKLEFVLKDFGVKTQNIYVIGRENILTHASVVGTEIHCAGSGINATIKAVFNDFNSKEYPELHNLLHTCRKLVSSVRDTRVHKKLVENDIPLQPEHSRCWNAIYTMLNSIQQAMPKLEECLRGTHEAACLYSVDRSLLVELVKLLKPFDEATKLLIWSNTPTLPLVVPTKVKLQRCLEAKVDDSPIIKELKKRLLQALNEKFHIDMVHCVATVLHPKMKGFVRQYLGDQMFDSTKEQIMLILNKASSPKANKGLEEPPEKKLQLEEDQCEFLSEVMRDYADGESDDDEQGELSFYLNSKNTTRFGDPLAYWKQNASLCTNLFKVAKCVLALPASGALCDMHTSEIGRKMDARKGCISSDLINNILIIHCATKV